MIRSKTAVITGGKAYLNLSAGKYVRYNEYSFLANEPSGIFGISSV